MTGGYAARFQSFASFGTLGTSPLYEALGPGIAADQRLLDIAAVAQKGQPLPNLMFGAVQYLLRRASDDPLARFYRSLTPRPAPPDQAFPDFRRFVLAHEEELRGQIATRTVNTNETGRCSLIRPGLALASTLFGDDAAPLHLIEVGASAGLVLNWPLYRIAYAGGPTVGPADSPLELACELRGGTLPPLAVARPLGAHVGLEQSPVDLFDADQTDWLRALIWPERVDRQLRFDHALAIARSHRPDIRQGDAARDLAALADELPAGPLVVLHAFVRYQFDAATEAAFEAALATIAAARRVAVLGLEWEEGDATPFLTLARPGDPRRTLASCDSHGTWLHWSG
ncbi:MAG: hypothetical protein JWM77_1571 [Rhodospirillales bacterium]|nr:hypothetical protein [Rhodospirillales bacterium]